MDRRAEIIGGGIGGLTAAVALHRAGWRVTVHEQAADLGGVGTALGIWPGALRALDTIGLGDAVRRTGVEQERGEFRRPDGSRIGTVDVRRLRRRTGDTVHLISRPALLDLLYAATPPGTVRFGERVPDARAADADLVVAADGVFSRTRTALFGAGYRARYTGATAWRGWTDGLTTDALTEIWGAGMKFGVTPQEGGRCNWYATTEAPERDFHPGAELTRLRQLFGTWPEPIPTLLGRITEAEVLRHDLYVVPRLPTFVHGRIALLGDAAHAMSPDLGRGACEAITDAVALTAAVQSVATTNEGLQRYDRSRRRPVQRLASASAAANRLARRRRLLWARDCALRVSLRLPMVA
jgi:2-polyprenyl-6-methoxyphenol hydroxylase-like FAD-dependent oxidoreductase